MKKDVVAERCVLAGLCQYGSKVYLDVADILQSSTFTIDSNQIIYQCIKHVLDQDDSIKIDIPTIYSTSMELGHGKYFDSTEEKNYLKTFFDFRVDLSNVRRFAAKIRKLEVARLLTRQLDLAKSKIADIEGHESITQILGIAEDTVFDFSSLIDEDDSEPKRLGHDLYNYIVHLGENPVKQIGISSGFTRWDTAIGGGLRSATVNVVGARIKVGKSMLSTNIGINVAKQNIPVLYLDTEMIKEDQQHRTLAALSGVEINKIETGEFYTNNWSKDKVLKSVKKLEKIPLYYKNISGMGFEEQLPIMRRWVVKEVGLTKEKKAKPCVILYDYLKLMNMEGLSADLKEYQMLGFLMTGLHNFSVRYSLPVVALTQLNRDGITKETTDTASGSDRILWLCSNFSILKRKSVEENANDGKDTGTHKLVVVVTRHGPGLEDLDYVNLHMKSRVAQVIEGDTSFEIRKKKEKEVFDNTVEKEKL